MKWGLYPPTSSVKQQLCICHHIIYFSIYSNVVTLGLYKQYKVQVINTFSDIASLNKVAYFVIKILINLRYWLQMCFLGASSM